jgi:hypothetical protein
MPLGFLFTYIKQQIINKIMVTAEINHLLLTVTFLHVKLFNFVNAYKHFGGTCNIYLHTEN